ncbi:phage tail assembly protein [Cyanobacteria bacterium FACHB-63]|nr:phage tail assembly protein [Cyanobacteria bacterium FACHB-63]
MQRKNELSTEFAFLLPRGLVDEHDRIHRKGVMRLATAKDEIVVQKELSVRESPAYGFLVMLSRVISRLGSLNTVNPSLLETLAIRDIAYLREFYNRINQQGEAHISTECPHCRSQLSIAFELSGES